MSNITIIPQADAGGTVMSVSGTLNRITSTGGVNPVIDISAAYVGQTSITTLGTITTGVWNGTAIGPTFGGTGQTTYTTGDILYASAANTLSKLPVGSNTQILTLVAGIPAWAAPATSGTVTSVSGTLNRITSTGGNTPVIDISAAYVGQTSITTLGTITTGVWNGTAVGATFGGTSQTTYTTGDLLYASAANTLSKLPIGTTGQILTTVAGVPAWADLSNFQGTGITVGATTADLFSVPLGAVAGTYQFEARVKGFESGTPAGCGYNVYGTFTTDGLAATLVGDQSVFNENAALVAADAYFVASGNNAVLQVLGVTALTINWSGEADIT